MANYFTIQIPESCSQTWEDMKPVNAGGHCDSCNKTVTDFSLMTDAQLVAFLKNPKETVCGRFYDDQLNRDMLIPKKQIPWLKYFFTISIPAFFLSQKPIAQVIKSGTVKVVSDNKSTVLNESTSAYVEGFVVNEKGEPVKSASFCIRGSRMGTATDNNGKFKLKINSQTDSFRISAVGHSASDFSVRNADKNQFTIYATEGAFPGMVEVKIVKRRKVKKHDRAVAAESKEISIYPNPVASNSVLNVRWTNSPETNKLIEIFSSGGQPDPKRKFYSFIKNEEYFYSSPEYK